MNDAVQEPEPAESELAEPEPAEPETAEQTGPEVSLNPVPRRSRLLALAIPTAVLVTAAGAAFLGWKYAASRDVQAAAGDSVAAAQDATVAILSYRADTAGTELVAARDRLTGAFLDSYTKLVTDVVIPGAKEKNITAVATVPAAASVSASADHAVALVFVDQTVTEGTSAPTHTNWSVRVTLDKVDGRWLVAGFDPV